MYLMDFKIIGRMILMLSIKHTLMVSTLSLGLVMGGVAVVSATTSATPANTSQTTPTHVTTAPITPEAVTPAPVAPVDVTPAVITPIAVPKATQNNYHYSDGHSNMTPQQHQQMHVTQPSEHHNTNMGEHHSESGHE